MYFHPAMPKKPSSQAPAQICAPHLTKLSIGGNCTSLKQLFTARDAPLLESASVHAMWDGPPRTMADGYINYVSCIEARATVSSLAALTDLSIELEEDGGPRICEPIANVLGPLIVFANMERDFWEVTGAWPRLREFSLAHASWASESHLDPDDDSEESESEDNPTPTPQILECFREDCPDLRMLRLPHLDVHAGVPGLFTRVPKLKGCAGHGLTHLWFGAQDFYERMMRGPMEPELGAEKVVEWARRYILHLFPNLDAKESLKPCEWSDTAVGWIEVFERVRDFGKSREGCSSGGTVSKSLRS
ncbi:hypothetical protein GSI_12290 [Ganoderma sinense ZZ0214-1]|uniref:Uncharacterized protein n=1 Tax=Ganoderma sinense ZZ0214-1 TaxID=1077348 RepID=A0A2G8RYE2_9APHY|nr:hypothetical protein GSI_12290 [Ganoderma sinense ZZ0214-1]